MTPSPTARASGVLVRWNDERGFGFIRRDSPGPKVFVHVSAFGPLERRPVDGDRVHFAIEVDDTGRAQAVDAEIEGVGRAVAMGSGRRLRWKASDIPRWIWAALRSADAAWTRSRACWRVPATSRRNAR